MAVAAKNMRRKSAPAAAPLALGGYAALAESAWMGAPQASEVLEPLRLPRARAAAPRGRGFGVARLFTREFTIAEAAIILMASFFFSALLGAVRQVLFNALFGVGREANAYYAAFRLPDTLFSLVAGGALSSAMIPVLLSTARAKGEAAGLRLVNLVLTTLVAVFALITLVGEIATPAFVTHLLAPGFDAETSRLTVNLTRVMLVQPVILAVGAVATALLNTALSVVSHNLALIAGIAATHAHPALGIYGPTLGVVGGALLQVLILLPGLLGRQFRYRPAWDFADPRLREVIRLLIPNGLAVAVGSAGFILDTAFASKAPEAAGLPALQNAWLLVGLPIALFGQAVGQSAFPRLAADAAAGEWARMKRTLLRTVGVVIALALPAMLGIFWLGRLAIRIIFEQGKFDAAAGSLTFSVLIAYTIGLPAYVATEVIIRGLIALRDTRTPLLTNSAQLAGRALLIAVLLDTMGVIAIPTAFAIMASLETVALALVLRRAMRLRMSPATATAFA
jgi:putative peptidoglycan lipid II flippase